MILAKIYVSLKPSVLDPKGKTITETLHAQGYESVKETRVSKFIEVKFDSNDKTAVEKDVEAICDKLLANPNIETYSYELQD